MRLAAGSRLGRRGSKWRPGRRILLYGIERLEGRAAVGRCGIMAVEI